MSTLSRPETDALKVELRAIEARYRGEVDKRNAAFRDQWAAKMQGVAPTELPGVIQVTWSCGDAGCLSVVDHP